MCLFLYYLFNLFLIYFILLVWLADNIHLVQGKKRKKKKQRWLLSSSALCAAATAATDAAALVVWPSLMFVLTVGLSARCSSSSSPSCCSPPLQVNFTPFCFLFSSPWWFCLFGQSRTSRARHVRSSSSGSSSSSSSG